jgi:hypothetical protein
MNRYALLAILALLVTACGLTKSMPGGYELEKWEDGTTFYLNAPGNTTQNGGGAIEGTVQHIAWNSEIIAAERYANFRGDPDGWMIINVKTKEISGPLSETKFSELRSKANLQVKTAAEAWSAL